MGAGFVQQRRRLAGALAAADDRDVLAAIAFGIDVLAGVAHQIARQLVERARAIFMAEHHRPPPPRAARRRLRRSPTPCGSRHCAARTPHNLAAVDVGRDVLLKPEP